MTNIISNSFIIIIIIIIIIVIIIVLLYVPKADWWSAQWAAFRVRAK